MKSSIPERWDLSFALPGSRFVGRNLTLAYNGKFKKN